jgi:hypothetical protein
VILRQRVRVCNGCPFFAEVKGGGCLKSTGDCIDCLSHREAVRDAVAYKDAVCPDDRWKKNSFLNNIPTAPERHQTRKAQALIQQKKERERRLKARAKR